MATPEQHLALARESLSRGDFSALLSKLADFENELRELTAAT